MLIDRGAKIEFEDPGHCSCLLLAAIHGIFFSPKTKKNHNRKLFTTFLNFISGDQRPNVTQNDISFFLCELTPGTPKCFGR